MTFTTLRAAQSELARRTYKHEVLKFEVHTPLCLHSDGTITAPYHCTCGGTGEHRYTLRLKQ
jgi:hypothetical protein